MPRKLKTIRKKEGYTLKSLAEASGVGASTIGNFENAKTEMAFDSLKRLAGVLKVEAEELIQIDTYPESTQPDRMDMVMDRYPQPPPPPKIEDRLEKLELQHNEMIDLLSDIRNSLNSQPPNPGTQDEP